MINSVNYHLNRLMMFIFWGCYIKNSINLLLNQMHFF
ncbi:hypothetical protein LTSEURB_4820, partial [Salmonella enterica subsp. enterica serovar Urbana str. R8-2977]